MNFKLKTILRVVLCIVFSMVLLCGCKNGKTNTSANTSGKNEYKKKEYVERITAYKEYYEDIENDYCSVNGEIVVHEDGMPYMVLSCTLEQDIDKYKILLIDYKDGKAVICGEKEFYEINEYGDYISCDVDIAFLEDRCVMRVQISAGEGGTEYWEFVEGNLLARKLSDEDARKFEEKIRRICHVYDISVKPYEYLYTYDNGKISIYDKESDIDTVNNIAAQRIQDYMQLNDEQKEYFIYDKKKFSHQDIKYELTAGVNICTFDSILIPLSFWGMEGVTFKQCLNELINEPLYRIEELMIKEYDFMAYNDLGKDMSQLAAEKKEEKLKEIYEKMPKYNPYDTDKRLLIEYHDALEILIRDYGELVTHEATDLATIVGTYDIKRVLDKFEAGYEFGGRKPLQYDFIFTSDEFKGATWKDITFNGSHQYPVLTLTKNGNTLSYSAFDSYVEFRENSKVKRAIEAYAECPEISNDAAFAFVYIDEDDIPEMITAYRVYSYENGQLIAEELNPDQWVGGYIPKGNSIAIFEEDYIYEEDGTSYRDGKYTQYSIVDDDIKYVKDIKWTEEYEPVTFEKDIISALEKIYSLRNE